MPLLLICCLLPPKPSSPGYGHTTPLSDTGKAFSIIYALIGVPFTMLVLTACVQRLMYPLVLAPVGVLQRSGMEPRPATVVHFILLLILVVLCFFVAPAAVFSAVELSWSFLDGIYFCFISLCTIGLGDFVPGMRPGQKNRQLYQVSVMGEFSQPTSSSSSTSLSSLPCCIFTCPSTVVQDLPTPSFKAWSGGKCLRSRCCRH